MRAENAILLALSLFLIQCVGATNYFLKDQWSGNGFFSGWDFDTEDDLTHGRVNYLSQEEAISKQLAFGEDSCATCLVIQIA
jgi:hypothetical protein